MVNLSVSGYVKVCHTLNTEINIIQNFPSVAYFGSHLAILVLNIFLSLSTIFLNFVTIGTFWSSIQLQKKICHFLIFVQSCNDLGIGLIVSPLNSIFVAGQLVGNANCDFFFAFYIIFFTIVGFSIAILSAMNLERYASIVHPVYHRNKVTKKKLLIYILSICALFIIVSLASVVSGRMVFPTFATCVFLLHFVSTIYFYTRIFLVGKAQLKRSEPHVDARQDNFHTPGNNRPMQQENHLGNRSDNQGNSSNTQRRLSDNQGELSNNHGEQYDNQDRPSDNQNNGSDNQARQLDTSERLPNNPGKKLDNQISRSDNQGNTPDNQSNRSDNRSEYTEQDSDRQSSSNENNNQSNQISSARKSEQEFLMKYKLAKSCLIVVVCSFTSFVLPAVFQPLKLSEFDKLILNGWVGLLVLSNSTLDSLIFFWKNNMLRNEAKKFLKNICF